MPEIAEADLKKQIKQKEFANVYLLHGQEHYLCKRYAQQLADAVCGDTFSDFNRQSFDGKTAAVDDIADAVEALPLMAQRKCVLVCDLDMDSRSAGDIDKIKELLSGLPKSCVLVFWMSSVDIDYKKSSKWKTFIALVNKSGCSVPFKERTVMELEKILCDGATKRGCTLSRQNAGRLVELCGGDLFTLLNELDKLCAYTVSGEISEQIISLVAVKNLEATVFTLQKALIAGSSEQAYEQLDILFYQREEPVAILAVLSSAYVDMYRARCAIEAGQSVLDLTKDFDYKGKEFRLKNAERDSRNMSSVQLRKCLNILLDADSALKGSRTDKRVILEEMIAKLMLAKAGSAR